MQWLTLARTFPSVFSSFTRSQAEGFIDYRDYLESENVNKSKDFYSSSHLNIKVGHNGTSELYTS